MASFCAVDNTLGPMRHPAVPAQSVSEKFASLERNALPSLGALCVLLAISVVLETPDLRHLALSAISGLSLYLTWIAAIRNRPTLTLVLMLATITCCASGLFFVVEHPFPMRFVQGIGTLGTTFLFLVVLRAKRQEA
jgi:hypothetical protein